MMNNAKIAEPTGEIFEQINNLDKEVNALIEDISKLGGKISPVLGGSTTKDEPLNDKAVGGLCPIADHLASIRATLATARTNIDDLHDRAQL